MLFLAGDIGGTKALLQLIEFEPDSSARQTLAQQRYLCEQFDSLQSIIQHFLHSFFSETDSVSNPIDSACFGLPGPVSGSRVRLTNLPWVVDAGEIEQACSINQVFFINDFHGAALGVEALSKSQLDTLYKPEGGQELEFKFDRPVLEGNFLVIGAGTGLGVAPVFFDGTHSIPVAHEGGHFDFAPISETQQCLLNWLWQEYEHVSYERVLSGPGLETLYQFFLNFDYPTSYVRDASQKLKKSRIKSPQNDQLGLFIAEDLGRNENQGSVSASEIHSRAEAGEPAAVKAMTEFVTIYGAFVGAVALLWNAPQGVFLAGGVASKIEAWMRLPYFREAYLEKGRMKSIVASRPVYLVADETLGLQGAMQYNLNQSQSL
ncbi:glucokinase [Thiomicrorhabdus chilensis]|uniref:glucokinase n=1 Tax=Thiomicrorhabdus chilensis TaxID=63656 RepID=UPI0004087054|nr:glucokinase [Thiomicrorhabdus chilensis]